MILRYMELGKSEKLQWKLKQTLYYMYWYCTWISISNFTNSKPDFVATLKGMLEELKVAEKCLVGEEEGRDGAIAKSVLKMKNEVSEIIMFSDFI